MAAFDRQRAKGEWIKYRTVTQKEWEAIDDMRPAVLNGRDGSTHAPTAPIVVGGSGIECTVTPTDDDDVANKAYVDSSIGGLGDIAWEAYQARNSRYFSSYSPSEAANSVGVALNATGTKMYVLEAVTTDEVFQYTLSTAWDVSTASYDSVSLDVSTETTSGADIYFGDSGSKLYVVESGNIYQYTVSSAYDLSTASYASKSVSLTQSGAACMAMSSDGTAMYIATTSSASAYQYTLSTPWDISTASYASKSLSVVSAAGGMFLSPDGKRLIVARSGSDLLSLFKLSTAGDLSTGAQDAKADLDISEVGTPDGITYSPDGTRLYICDSTAGTVVGYYSAVPTIG